MVPFMTSQRLMVMLVKTSVSYHLGCLQGSRGPGRCPVPELKCYTDESPLPWKVYRWAEDVLIIRDCPDRSATGTLWARFIFKAHGVLLRRLGKERVIYCLRTSDLDGGRGSAWHSNINLVTGVSKSWLDKHFTATATCEAGVIAGTSAS